MMQRSIFRRVLLPLVLVIGAFSVAVPAAQALTEHPYGNTLLEPGQTRFSPEGAIGTTITGNIAAYEGAGTVNVCQRTFDFTSNVYREGCGNGSVGNALNLMPYFGHQLWPAIKNNSPFAHTIRGWYYTNP
jgi:hypothetical protein